MTKPAAEMSHQEILADRKWPAHLTIQQMREQIEWEQHPEFAATTARLRAEYAAAKASRAAN